MSRSRSFRIGLLLLGVLSVLDVLLPFMTDGEQPPMAVAVAAAVLGALSLVLVVSAWRGAARAVPALIVLRLLSAASALPALFAPAVDAVVMSAAATIVVLTLIGTALVVGLPSRRLAGSR